MLSGITGTFAKGPKPAAIPEFRVRYPRITHPFATRFSQVLPPEKTPFDLHALATPPAFVLSQDQTLHFFIVAANTRPKACAREASIRGIVFGLV